MIHKTAKQHMIEKKRMETARRRKYGLCLKDKSKRTYSMDHKPYEGMLKKPAERGMWAIAMKRTPALQIICLSMLGSRFQNRTNQNNQIAP